MKVSEISKIICKHCWLVSIAEDYIKQRKRLKYLSRNIQITEIKFICCSDVEEIFRFNLHHTIDPKPFLDAIDKEIEDIKAQIREIEESLPMIEFKDKIEE